MATKKLIHPRKVVWIMRDFINEISDLVDPNTYYSIPQGVDLGTINFNDYIVESPKRKCKMIKSHGFCTFFDNDTEYIKIGYNLNQHSVSFRKNFESLCPLAKGFANVTIYLLHELGHQYTENQVEDVEPEYDREFAMMMGQMLCDTQEAWDDYYFNTMVDEMLATKWAVEWLQNAENRKIAKAFERKFFACFK